MDWLCSWCKQPKQMIQEYPLNKQIEVGAVSSRQARMGHATKMQTEQNTKKQLNNLKLRKQYQFKNDKEGFSIEQIKKNKSADGVFKKIQKSQYEQILKQCQKTGKPWKDPDFSTQINDYQITWKRISEYIPKYTLMGSETKINDIMQGLSNDCYYLTATAAIAQRDYRIRNIFGSTQANKWGVYMCKLYYNGIYQQVVVDDYFPFITIEVANKEELYASRPTNGTDIWVMVLEKCWAKLQGGYGNIEFRYNNESMETLTGSPVYTYFTSLFRKDSAQSRKLFNKILQYNDKYNYAMTTSVTQNQLAKQVQLASKHSYTLIGVFASKNKQGNPVNLALIKNPLKNKKMPKLLYSFQDSFWSSITPEQKDRLQNWRIQNFGQDGIFYVEWQQFLLHFNQICVAKINDNAHYLYNKVKIQKGKPIFVSVQLNSCDSKFHLFVVQKFDNSKNATEKNYVKIRVLVASVSSDYKNQNKYNYICSKSFIGPSSKQTSHLCVDFGDNLQVGKYYARIYTDTKDQRQIVLGYHTSNSFKAETVNDVIDGQFVSKTLLSRARSNGFIKNDEKRKVIKEKLVNADGWRCIQNIFQSNIGYIAYHIDHSSLNQNYSIEINSKKDNSFAILEGIGENKRELKLPIKRGEEVLIPYVYATKWLQDTQTNPSLVDDRTLPNPTLVIIK